MQLCIDTLAAFGHQTEDLNIALTSVGLLWNISDFIQQSLRDLSQGNAPQTTAEENASGAVGEIVLLFPDPELSYSNLSGLWMLLLFKISTLCSDVRPEVRNGAIQTLLRTIQINASGLDMRAWRQCVWRILLPLLGNIQAASCRKIEEVPEPVNTGAFVMRNDSPTKQWDETHVLLYSGLSDVFQNFFLQLIRLDDYLEAWVFLMEHLETASLFSSPDVAIAALKGIQTMMKVPAVDGGSPGAESLIEEEREKRLSRLWDTAWAIWERIGCAIVNREPSIGRKRTDYQANGRSMTTQFTQETLTEYVNIMRALYPILQAKFQLQDLRAFLDVVHLVLIFDGSPIYRPDVDYLSPLQLAIHDTIILLDLNSISGGPAAVLDHLASQFMLAFEGDFGPAGGFANTPVNSTGPVRPTYIALCKVTVTRIVFLLEKFQRDKGIYADGVYARVLKVLDHTKDEKTCDGAR